METAIVGRFQRN